MQFKSTKTFNFIIPTIVWNKYYVIYLQVKFGADYNTLTYTLTVVKS